LSCWSRRNAARSRPGFRSSDRRCDGLASIEIQRTARAELAKAGRLGLQAMIEHYRDEAQADRLVDIGREISNKLSFPHSIHTEPDAAAPAHRRAAATIMTLLLNRYQPGDGVKEYTELAGELMKLAEGNDWIFAGRPVTTIFYVEGVSKAIGPERMAEFLKSKDRTWLPSPPRKRSAPQNRRREVPEESLYELLKSSDRELRRRAADRLFQDTHKKIDDPQLYFAQLDSPYPDVQQSAARYLVPPTRFETGWDLSRSSEPTAF
jgi:hypothetical protein